MPYLCSMKVSVAIITFNQAKFIGKAIESALMQQTNFDFEILVGDDFSNDGTREIIQDYAQRYPNKVVPVLHPRNLGKNGLFNTLETYKLAKGEYLAAFDGDDYWTNPLKLQKQVDFLDANPDFVCCYHNALVTHEDGSPSYNVNPPDQAAVTTLDDLIGVKEIWFMATSAVMFRNVLPDPPAWVLESNSGDIPRYILLAKIGKIGYLPDVMSVYRKNHGGMSFVDSEADANFLNNRIAMYKGIDKELNYKYHTILRKNIARYVFWKATTSREYKDNKLMRAFFALQGLWYSRPNPDAKQILLDYVIPSPLAKIYANVKGFILSER